MVLQVKVKIQVIQQLAKAEETQNILSETSTILPL